MMFYSAMNNHNTVSWKNNLNDLSDLDDDSGNELPLSSIADFLHPIDQKLKNSELQKCETIDNQVEENNDKSIEHSLHPFDNKFLKCEAVDCQSKEKIDHCNKSEPNRLICNNEQCTIDDLLEIYECDICGDIFPTRTDIITHFKIALCYPETT